MPDKDKIYISEFDLKRLKELIKVAEEFGDKRVLRYLRSWTRNSTGRSRWCRRTSRMTSLP
jgi:hypothetical protein